MALPGVALTLGLMNLSDARKDGKETAGAASLAGNARRFVAAQFRRDALVRWIAWGAPIALALGLIAWLNWRHFGELRPAYSDQPEGINFGTPLLIGLHGFLFSIGRGLFFFSPPLILFFWAIRPFLRQEPELGWGLLASIALFLAVQSMWINWAGGWCWGPRHIFMIHWMLALPVAVLLRAPRSPGVRVAWVALMFPGVAAQVYGSAVNFNDYYKTHFRDLDRPPRAMALYAPSGEEPFLRLFYRIQVRPQPGAPWQDPPLYSGAIVAPINDSVYIYQNSQWPGNARCLARGLHDVYWLHLARALRREPPPDLGPVSAPGLEPGGSAAIGTESRSSSHKIPPKR